MINLEHLEQGTNYSLLGGDPTGELYVLFTGIVGEENDSLIDDFIAVGIIRSLLQSGEYVAISLDTENTETSTNSFEEMRSMQ